MHFGAKEMTNSDLEAAHRKVLEHLAVKLTEGTTMVLKGGTALFLRYGLDRFSTDLDFDSGKKFSLEQRIKAAFKDLGTVENFSTPKDTETVTRHKCEYEVDGVRGRLKLEVSHRGTAEDENIRLLDGIRTYNVAELLKQKLAAIKGRHRAEGFIRCCVSDRKVSRGVCQRASAPRRSDRKRRSFIESIRHRMV